MASESEDRQLLQVKILRTKTQKFRGLCVSQGTDMGRVVDAWIDAVLAGEPLPAKALKPKQKKK